MQIKESHTLTSLQNWGGGGEPFQFYLSIRPIIIEAYHFSSLLNTLKLHLHGMSSIIAL